MAPLQRSKSASQTGQLQIQHFIHHHLLNKLYMTAEFNCDGCNTGGYGVRYRCSGCDFDLHEQCATAPHRISTSLHAYHHLILVNRPGDSHVCHVCKGVTNGLSYTCEINHACEFNVHALCIQIPPATATGDKSLSLVNTTALGGYNGEHQMQATPAATSFGGYNGVSNSQSVMQGMHDTTAFGGYHGVNNSQHMMVIHQQQKQGIPTTSFGGYYGVNNNNNNNNNQAQMINHHQHPQPQVVQQLPTVGYDGYHGGMNSQPVMVNHQQPQLMHTTSFNGNQQFMNNNNQQQQVQQQSNGYTKVGKMAANILSASLIGVPIFMSKR